MIARHHEPARARLARYDTAAASSTSPSGWCRRAASTASATRTSPPSSASPRRACTTTSPTKAELGRTLIARYTDAFAGALHKIKRSSSRTRPSELRAYVELYADVLSDERMCLCGMVAAEYGTLPAPMQSAIGVLRVQRELARRAYSNRAASRVASPAGWAA